MAAVIAAVLALLATPTSNAVAVAPGESFPGYAYDGTRASEPFDDTAAERGPPGPNDRAMTYDAVDRWSHGASASPDIATPGPTRTYTAPGGPPQVVEAAGKTQAGARADVGGLSSLARAGVAANAGAHVLPKALSGGPANTHVYLGIRSGKPVYGGITNNLARRSSQHGARFDQLQQVTSAPVTRGQARAIEQALIVRNGAGFENKINSISPTHSYYDDAVSWGESWLKQNGY
ncbi:hypothetical protein [Cellulomonas sp. PSBB021]|uniref:hypothetical protein n=1 Tax=Cellulomonas sp. PSBB021 TaxID=2003551 RepID=UPI0018E05768|nr:hypothetical protein [Cellulomonas sp. PSBB021]